MRLSLTVQGRCTARPTYGFNIFFDAQKPRPSAAVVIKKSRLKLCIKKRELDAVMHSAPFQFYLTKWTRIAPQNLLYVKNKHKIGLS